MNQEETKPELTEMLRALAERFADEGMIFVVYGLRPSTEDDPKARVVFASNMMESEDGTQRQMSDVLHGFMHLAERVEQAPKTSELRREYEHGIDVTGLAKGTHSIN